MASQSSNQLDINGTKFNPETYIQNVFRVCMVEC